MGGRGGGGGEREATHTHNHAISKFLFHSYSNGILFHIQWLTPTSTHTHTHTCTDTHTHTYARTHTHTHTHTHTLPHMHVCNSTPPSHCDASCNAVMTIHYKCGIHMPSPTLLASLHHIPTQLIYNGAPHNSGNQYLWLLNTALR